MWWRFKCHKTVSEFYVSPSCFLNKKASGGSNAEIGLGRIQEPLITSA